MTQKLITDSQLDGISGAKVTGAVANATLAALVTTNANLTGDVTSIGNATTLGTVTVSKGGTNLTSYTTGDLPYASATNVLSKLGVGTTGQVLTIAGGVPSWATPAGAATWGSITGTLSSQTDLNGALSAKADSASPSLSGTITLANSTKIFGDFSTLANRPYFQSNTGVSTFVMAIGTGTGSTNAAYYSAFGSSDFTNSNFVSLGSSQSGTTPYALYFGSTISSAFNDPAGSLKFIGRGTLTTYASINPSTAASASTDLTRLSDITVSNLTGTLPLTKGGTGQTTAGAAGIALSTAGGLLADWSANPSAYFIGTNGVISSTLGVPNTAKYPAKLATTANITLSGHQTIDGVLTTAGTRVLVKDQSTPSENGIYIAKSGAWSRSNDGGSNSVDLLPGITCAVVEGTANATSIWIQNSATPTYVKASGAGGGSGTVTSVSVATANGVSGSVANATTTPAITLTLGAITPSSVAATGTVSGTNLSGTNTGDQTITLTGDVTGTGTGSFATTLATVPATKGGTGQTTITTGDVLYGSAANTISKLGIGSAGQVLTVAGGVPTWAAAGGGSSLNAYKEAVKVASTANAATLTTAFQNGSVVDDITLVTGDRVLIKNQSTASQNGIYIVNASGSPTRAADFDTTGAEVNNGAIIPIISGTRNGGTIWTLTSGGGTIGNSFIFTPLNGSYVQGMTTPPITTGVNAIVMGNAATATNSSLVIGTSAFGAGPTAIAIGTSANGSSNAIAIGSSAIANANAVNSIAIGNSTSVIHALAVSLGQEAKSANQCAMVLGLGYFSAAGDAAITTQQAWMTTSNATPTTLGIATNYTGPGLTTPTGFIALSNDSSYLFDCDIVARNTATDTESAMYNLKFGIRRGAAAANTAIVGSPVLTVIGQDTGTTTWDVTVTADTTNGRPSIQVTGQASKTIRWLANISITKVSG